MDTAIAVRAAGAAARLTRLVALDTLLDVPRTRVEDWANRRKHGDDYDYEQAENDPHPLATLVSCTWCSGFWVSTAVAASAYAFGHTRTWRFAADTLTLSYVAAALVNRADA